MIAARLRGLVSAGVLAAVATSVSAQSDVFRYDDLDLRDPHVFVAASILGCRDVTNANITGFSINETLQARIQTDGDGDGLLDLSSLIEFLPLNQSAATNLMDSGRADCVAPLASTSCGPLVSGGIAGDASLSGVAACLAPVAGSTRPYATPVTHATAPCFASPVGTLTLDLGGIPVTLRDAQLAASFVGVPATRLANGLVRGFISEADADATILPPGFPLVGGQALSSVLPGGSGNCAAHDDRDIHQGSTGWWFYLNYTAPRVPEAVDPFANGFADGFE